MGSYWQKKTLCFMSPPHPCTREK